MAIPDDIKIKGGELPAVPGVYLMKGERGRLLYVGKATSLRSRVSSYFVRPADARIAKMVTLIRRIDYLPTPTTIEALVLESRLIKKYQPPYNILEKDDKSYIHLAFTREPFPRPVMIRGHELARMPKRQFLRVFGPFDSASDVQAALDALRRVFPWTLCRPGAKRPCFYRHLGLCPGVCTDEISSRDYRRIISQLFLFFDGRRSRVLAEIERAMRVAAAAENYEEAAALRNRLRQLGHIQDIAVLRRRDAGLDQFVDAFGRIEGYDISNIGGRQAVGSLVVFEDGRPRKTEYRRFIVRTERDAGDVAMLAEVLERRFRHAPPRRGGGAGAPRGRWPLPDLMLVDGGAAQVAAARRVLKRHRLDLPVIGVAKGPDRKRDELIYDHGDHELARLAAAVRPLFQRVRDEAHRFAITFHRRRRAKEFLPAV
ncbi:MAG: UvrB/UvrC motif-containing protein [Patescibacteria group bacterium]|jgi:excinuclease ABC subunit C